MNKELKVLLMAGAVSILTFACGGSGKTSISVMPSLDEFKQHDTAEVKIDILFMIDDSGSMKPGQTQLQQNFVNFVSNFYGKGYDFRLAVGKTSAYGSPSGDESGRTVTEFRCGQGNNCGGVQETQTCSSVATTKGNGLIGVGTDHILSSLSLTQAELVSRFARNADVGICGTGTERALQSTKEVLDNMGGILAGISAEPFPRPNAHFAVIHVGDENDDGSLGVAGFNSISDYVNHLEAKGAEGTSVHAIQVTGESNCKAGVGYYGGVVSTGGTIHSGASAGDIQFEMALMTLGGSQISICEKFADSLADLGDNIGTLASVFTLAEFLDSHAISTLKVYVEGVNGNNPLPQSTVNGYKYDPSNKTISFYGTMTPPEGAVIGVSYTCGSLGC